LNVWNASHRASARGNTAVTSESTGAGKDSGAPPPLPVRLFGPTSDEQLRKAPRWFTVAALLAIVVLAAWLRISRLGDLPAGFYCDEAGLGYNAYSLLKTGRDENGTHWPLYIWSFDTSYKNPVFVYAAMLPMSTRRADSARARAATNRTATVLGPKG